MATKWNNWDPDRFFGEAEDEDDDVGQPKTVARATTPPPARSAGKWENWNPDSFFTEAGGETEKPVEETTTRAPERKPGRRDLFRSGLIQALGEAGMPQERLGGESIPLTPEERQREREKADRRLGIAELAPASVASMDALIYRFINSFAQLTGTEGVKKWSRGLIEEKEERLRSAFGDKQMQRVEDVESIQDAFQFVKETMVMQSPIIALTVGSAGSGAVAGAAIGATRGATSLGATVGGMTGAFSSSFMLNAGEVQQRIEERDPSVEAPGVVFGAGGAAAALDSIVPYALGRSMARAFGSEAAEYAATKILLTPVTEAMIARTASGAAKGLLTEAVTEAAQSVIMEVAAAQATNQEINWEEFKWDLLNEAAAGALMGAGMGAATGALNTYADSRAGRLAAGPQVNFRPDITDPDQRRVMGLPPLRSFQEEEADSFTKVTEDDVESPIPTEIIREGKNLVGEALGTQQDTAQAGSTIVPLYDMDGEQVGWLDTETDEVLSDQQRQERMERGALRPLFPGPVRGPREEPPTEQEEDDGLRTQTQTEAEAPAPTEVTAPFDPIPLVPEAEALLQGGFPANPKKLAKKLGITPDQASRVMMQIAQRRDSFLFVSRSGQIRKIPKRKGPVDALTYIAERGGIADNEGHDLKNSAGFDSVFIPGVGPLLRRRGLSIEEVGELLVEGGYMAPNDVGNGIPTEAEVLEYLDTITRAFPKSGQSATSGWLLAFAPEDRADVAERIEAARLNPDEQPPSETDRIVAEIKKALSSIDVELTPSEMEQAVALYRRLEESGQEFTEEAFVMSDLWDSYREARDMLPAESRPEDSDVPFEWDEPNAILPQGTPEQGQRPSAQEGAPQAAPEAQPGTAQGERTPRQDGGSRGDAAGEQQQGLMPSLPEAEDPAIRDRNRQLAQLGVNSPLRPGDRAEQADVDGLPMFDVARSPDLFDQPPAPPPTPPAPEVAPPPQEPPQAAKPRRSRMSGWGETNKGVSKEEYERLRAELRERLRNKLSAGLDPEDIAIALKMAAFHVEAGARRIAEVAALLAEDLGMTLEQIRPHMESIYMGARGLLRQAGVDVRGMDSLEAVEAFVDGKEATDDASGTGGLEPDSRTPAPQDQRSPQNLPDETRTDGSGEQQTGSPDVQGQQPEGAAGLSGGLAPVVGAGRSGGSFRSGSGSERGSSAAGQNRGSTADRGDGPPAATKGTENAEEGTRNPPSVEQRIKAQREASKIRDAIEPGNLDDVKKHLPILMEGQAEDVADAERRFMKAPGKLFTNGTGTGKTFVGAGVIARMVKQGKSDILVLAPSQSIVNAWLGALNMVQVQARRLESTTDGGTGVVVTTYANLTENSALATREFDLVVADEAHSLMQSKDGTETATLARFRAITGKPSHKQELAKARHPEIWTAAIRRLAKRARDSGPPLEQWERDLLTAAYGKIQNIARDMPDARRSRVLFLSATPFAYPEATDWAEGYLFDYPPEPTDRVPRYNEAVGRNLFMVQNFGYRMAYNRLTKPEPSVSTEIMEREFHERLKREGALSARMLDVPFDYNRQFVLVKSGIGSQIDSALQWLSDHHNDGYGAFWKLFSDRFDYLSRLRLLEAIKADQAIPLIRAQLDANRKVVVFHNYNEGGGINPFKVEFYSKGDTAAATAIRDRGSIPVEQGAMLKVSRPGGKVEQVPFETLYNRFVKENPGVLDLDFGELPPPRERLKQAFPDILLFSGRESAKARAEAISLFNDDNSGRNLILVQQDAGNAGISLHDTTGKMRRTLLNLGVPVRPVHMIQTEGRIYRVGQQSDSLFLYMNTGTAWERDLFARRMAERSSTAENLAMGSVARALRATVVEAFNNSGPYEPSDDDAKGGKERDRQMEAITPFERAMTYYFGRMKQRGRRDQRAGVDYFATPEPIGYMMVQWADLKVGDSVLEPSAGHGAISRFFPESTRRTIIEPSMDLHTQAAVNTPGARAIMEPFESLNLVNKFDAIVMNPPFGTAGKTAQEHLDKAARHLRNGGRLVALVPSGPAMDKRVSEFMASREDLVLMLEVILPAVTFEREGTAVRTRILVFERQVDPSDRLALASGSFADFSGISDIRKLFTEVQSLTISPRHAPSIKEADNEKESEQGDLLKEAEESGKTQRLVAGQFKFGVRASAGKVYVKPVGYVGDRFGYLREHSARFNGSYISGKGFEFSSMDDTQGFLAAVANGEPAPTEAKAEEVRNALESGRPAEGLRFSLTTDKHGKTGQQLWVAVMEERVPRDVYERLNAMAKKHGGYYSRFGKAGFQFPSQAGRDGFVQEATGSLPPSDGPPDGNQKFSIYVGAPFYDPAIKAIEKLAPTRTSPRQWLARIRNMQGIPNEALEWSGLVEWLEASEAQSLSRDEVLAFLRNGGVVIEETTSPLEPSEYDVQRAYDFLLEQAVDEADMQFGADDFYVEVETITDDEDGSITFRVGNEDYDSLEEAQERALEMADEARNDAIREYASNLVSWDDAEAQARNEANLFQDYRHNPDKKDYAYGVTVIYYPSDPRNERIKPFEGSHFDELAENVIMHIRHEQRRIAERESVTHLQEIQSDLHQLLRKLDKIPDIATAERLAEKAKSARELAMSDFADYYENHPDREERALFEADPETVARRRDIRQLALREREAENLVSQMRTVGKDPRPLKDSWVQFGLKRAIVLAVERGDQWVTWNRGDPIAAAVATKEKTGLIAFYDTVVPRQAAKLIKKWGGKVEEVLVPSLRGDDEEGDFFDGRVMGFRITPAMIEAVKGDGLPMFQAGPKGKVGFERRFIRPDRLARAYARLSARLKELGLSDRVALRVSNWFRDLVTGKERQNISGAYMNRLISIALNATDANGRIFNPDLMWTLNHEIIHALRDMGLFTEAEWNTLKRWADSTGLVDGIIREYKAAGVKLTRDQAIEEVIANGFADWAAGRRRSDRGFLAKAWQAIASFFRALGSALKGQGFRTADDVFRAIDEGRIGRRETRGQPPQDRQAMSTGERRAQPGMNIGRLANMLGPQFYGNAKDMARVVVKETLQNAADAIRPFLNKGDGFLGRIEVRVQNGSRTLVMRDNGTGMSPDTLAGPFLTIAGSMKEGERASGGFGVAKLLFLYGTESLDVITMRDGIVSSLSTTGAQLMEALENPDASPTIYTRPATSADAEMFPDGHGTQVTISIPETVMSGDETIGVYEFQAYTIELTKSLLLDNIEVQVETQFGDRDTLDIGARLGDRIVPFLAPIKTKYGTINVYLDTGSSPYISRAFVMSNGLYQFHEETRQNPIDYTSPKLPHDVYIDIRPNVKADSALYPFALNRQDVKGEARKDLSAILLHISSVFRAQETVKHGEFWENASYMRAGRFAEALRLPFQQDLTRYKVDLRSAASITVEDGVIYADGERLPEIKPEDLKSDVAGARGAIVIPQDAVDHTSLVVQLNGIGVVSGNERVPILDDMIRQFGVWRVEEYLWGLGSRIMAMRQALMEHLPGLGATWAPKGDDYVIGLAVIPRVYGMNMTAPFRAIWVNPLAIGLNGWFTSDPEEAAFMVWETMIHETAHIGAMNHNAEFAQLQGEVYVALQKMRRRGLWDSDNWIADLASHFEAYRDILEYGRRAADEHRIVTIGEHLVSPENQHRPPSGAQAILPVGDAQSAGRGEQARAEVDADGLPPGGRTLAEGGSGPGKGSAETEAGGGQRFALGSRARSRTGTSLGLASSPSRVLLFRQHNASLIARVRAGLSPSALAAELDEWRYYLQDRFLPVLRLEGRAAAIKGGPLSPEQSPYSREELMAGRIGYRMDQLANDYVGPMMQALAAAEKLGITIEDFEEFLYARHAPERNARISSINPKFQPGEGSGMTDKEAARIMADFRRRGVYDELQRLAAFVDDMNAWALKLRVDSGLMSEQDAQRWQSIYPHWVPLRGEIGISHDDHSGTPQGGSGITARGAESPRALGRESQATDLLATAIQIAQEAIDRAEKNRVALAVLELARAVPEKSFWQINKITMKPVIDRQTGMVMYRPSKQIPPEDQDYTIVAKENGVEFRITLNRKNPTAARVAASLRNLDSPALGPVMSALAGLNRWLSMVNTMASPEFIAVNFTRDLQTGLTTMSQQDVKGLRRAVLKDLGSAAKGLWMGVFHSRQQTPWSNWYHEFAENGGRIYFNRIEDLPEIRRRYERQLALYRGVRLDPDFARATWNAAWGVIEKLNLVAENAVRLSTYKNLRERGYTPEAAASVARNLTVNFNRRGAYGTSMNALYLFYNASVQGMHVVLSSLRHRRVRQIIAGMMMLGFFSTLLNSMLAAPDDDDDEENRWNMISDFEKQRHLIFMYPKGVTLFGQDRFTMPLPYGFNVFHSMGRYAAELTQGRPLLEILPDMLQVTLDSFNPIGGASSLFNILAPTVADPLVDLARNRNFMNRPIRPEPNPFQPPDPASTQYFNNTPPQWRWTARKLSEWTGGDSVRPGAIEISPNDLQYLAGFAFGSAGTFVDRLVSLGPKMADPNYEMSMNDIVIARRFFGATTPASYRSLFYERVREADEVVRQHKAYVEQGRTADAARVAEENAGLMSMEPINRKMRTEMRAFRNQRRLLVEERDAGNISRSEYTARIKDLQESEMELLREYHAIYRRRVAN